MPGITILIIIRRSNKDIVQTLEKSKENLK